MPENIIKFRSLTLENWRQFRHVEIKFHPQLTIITGANGAGKSTLLQLLTRHFGYSRHLLATPYTKSGKNLFSSGIFEFFRSLNFFKEKKEVTQQINIGNITYNNDGHASITVPPSGGIQYDIQIHGQMGVSGIHVDSHRPPTIYRHVGQIETSPITKDTISNAMNGEFINYFNSGNSQQGSLYHIKRALISMSIFGHGNQTMEPMPELIKL